MRFRHWAAKEQFLKASRNHENGDDSFQTDHSMSLTPSSLLDDIARHFAKLTGTLPSGVYHHDPVIFTNF